LREGQTADDELTLLEDPSRKSTERIVDRSRNHRRSVFVAGASKNSTGIVCDALNYDRRYRHLFEPFSDGSALSTALQQRLLWREYVSPTDRSSVLRHHGQRILTGRIRSPHVDRWTKPGVYDRRLITESRLNLWLGWLHLNFEGLPMVLVMRHPCAAVSSRLLLERSTRLNHVLQTQELVSRYLTPFASTIEAAKSPLERHALMWAIEHYVPLHQFTGGGLHVILYERFVSDPQAELKRLLIYLGESPTPDRPLDIRFDECARVLDTWRKQLSLDDARRIMEIVAAFGLDSYYALEAEPKPPARQEVRNSDFPVEDEPGVALSAAQIGAITQELNDNLARLERYLENLKLRLYMISDGDQWQMHDWDWLWPRHEPFEVINVAWASARAMPVWLDQSVSTAIEAAYDIFQTMPPPLDQWAATWDGERNTFIGYMQAGLERVGRLARAQVHTATEQLSGQRTG